jgi:zinc protease
VPHAITRAAAAAFTAITLLTTASADPARASGPEVSHFHLANGLEVVVIPDHRTPVVTHMLWYRVGSADETPGKSGLAHFLEHLLFKGTKKNPQGLFSKTVATIGGNENAFTSSDYTGYFQRVTRDRLKLMMEFESDRMTGLILTDDVVKPELQVVLEEQNSRVANNPGARLAEQMEAALYLNHPYGRPVIGWRHEIEGLTRDDAIAFYKRFYTPRRQGRRGEGARRGDLRQGAARHRGPAAHAAARAGAGGAAHGHACRSASRAAERAALLPRALLQHRQAR